MVSLAPKLRLLKQFHALSSELRYKLLFFIVKIKIAWKACYSAKIDLGQPIVHPGHLRAVRASERKFEQIERKEAFPNSDLHNWAELRIDPVNEGPLWHAFARWPSEQVHALMPMHAPWRDLGD